MPKRSLLVLALSPSPRRPRRSMRPRRPAARGCLLRGRRAPGRSVAGEPAARARRRRPSARDDPAGGRPVRGARDDPHPRRRRSRCVPPPAAGRRRAGRSVSVGDLVSVEADDVVVAEVTLTRSATTSSTPCRPAAETHLLGCGCTGLGSSTVAAVREGRTAEGGRLRRRGARRVLALPADRGLPSASCPPAAATRAGSTCTRAEAGTSG